MAWFRGTVLPYPGRSLRLANRLGSPANLEPSFMEFSRSGSLGADVLHSKYLHSMIVVIGALI